MEMRYSQTYKTISVASNHYLYFREKKRMKKHIVLFALALSALNLFAQIGQVLRKEIEMDEEGLGYTSVLGEFGVLTHGRVNIKGAPDEWQITHFNGNFEKRKETSFVIPDKHSFNGFVVSADNKKVYFIFRGSKYAFHICTYDVITGSTSTANGKFPPKFIGVEFKELNGNLFVKGYIKREQTLITINAETGQTNLARLPGLGQKLVILDIEPSSSVGLFAVSVRFGKKIDMQEFHICFFDETGEKAKESVVFKNGINKFFVSASVTWTTKTDFYISGSYSVDKDYIANGLYLTEYKNDEQLFIQYYNFGDLKNFTSFLSKKKQDKINKKVVKKKEKGSEDLIESNVITHPIFKQDGELILIAESYFATYRTETTTTYVNGRPQTTTRQVFDGWQYSHATVLGIDNTGNKKWDHCFEMFLIYKPFSVIRNIRKATSGKEIKLLFSTGNIIKSLLVSKSEVVEKEVVNLKTDVEGDKVKNTGETESQYWYDNYFICYGRQKIKNFENKSVDRKRIVYFLQKIKFD